MKVDFSVFPVLVTSRLTLRKVTMEDLPEILFLRSDTQVLAYIDKEPATLEEVKMFIQKIEHQEQKGECVTWAMVPKGDAKLIGTICLWNLDPETGKAEVGYSMHPEYHGSGFMHEAMRAVIDYGINTMQVKVIEAYTHRENKRSRNLLERNGFTRDTELEAKKVGVEEPLTATIYSIRRSVN